jgi:hypothetical protein
MSYHPRVEINALKTERGLALQDLIGGAYEYVETIDFKPHARIYLIDQLASTEYVRLTDLLPCFSRANSLILFGLIDIDCLLVGARKFSCRHY